MDGNPSPKQILLIDRQLSWLERSAQALRSAGFDVHTLNHYDYPLSSRDHGNHDLVILGCPNIGDDEQDLILRVLEHREHLLVLSTLMPWRVMRSLFLIGAADVADKPYDSDLLISIVNQLFENMSPAR